MPPRSLSDPMPQETLPWAHPTVWQQLPEPQRQQCHALMAQWLTALVHDEQRKEHNHEGADASHTSPPDRVRLCPLVQPPASP